MGSSQSIAFPVVILNAAVAEACGELAEEIRAELKKTPKTDDAVLKVVRKAFKETSAVRFDGNGYSAEWVKEAAKRGLKNLRRTPEALAQLTTKEANKCLVGLGILTDAEVDSRYHIRLERYIKDLQIEAGTLGEMVDTLALPAAFSYSASLIDAAAKAKSAGIKGAPQVEAANALGKQIKEVQKNRVALAKVCEKAVHLHSNPAAQAAMYTGAVSDAMKALRDSVDALELAVDVDCGPLPKYREMLFPV